MIEDTNLTHAREELKRQLVDGEYKSSIEEILETVGRFLQKLTRQAKPPASWISAFAIALLISLIAYVSSLLTGDLSRYGYRTIASGGALIFLNMVIAIYTFRRTFATLQDKVLDGLESSVGLTGLTDWLAAVGDLRRPALVGLFVYAAYVVAFVLPDPAEVPVDLIVVGAVMLFWTGFLIYYMYLFVVLPLRLSHCHFKLHAEDPISTEVLVEWSGMMNFAAYMFAFMLAMGTLFTVTMVTFRLRILIFVIPRWLPLIVLFVANQMAISRVISRSKRKLLNQVEAQMAAMRPRSGPPDKETKETLLWLWDYHDRIKGTRNSGLDIKGIMNMVNTLLIPLLAFLIANREAIFNLVGWSP